jgi:hypothetical protein
VLNEDVHDEVLRILNSGKAYYYSVQNVLSPALLRKGLIKYTE